jgi:hypothetical protein
LCEKVKTNAFKTFPHKYILNTMVRQDTKVKQRWREWLKKAIVKTRLRAKPHIRRTLLLDPQLFETEMLESIGYRARNITVVEKKPDSFAELVDRNEWRKKKGKEQVTVVHADLEDFFFDMVQGGGKRPRFHHMSLDLYYQFHFKHKVLLALVGGGRFMEDDSILITNLQAQREPKDISAEHELLWDYTVERLSELALAGDKSVVVAPLFQEPGEEARPSSNGVNQFRCNHRVLSELELSMFSNVLRPNSYPIRFAEFCKAKGCSDQSFLETFKFPVSKDSLISYLAGVFMLKGKIAQIVTDKEIAQEPTLSRTKLPIRSLADLMMCHSGDYSFDDVRMYRYINEENTPMLTAFYKFHFNQYRLRSNLLSIIEKDFYSILGNMLRLIDITPPIWTCGSKAPPRNLLKKALRNSKHSCCWKAALYATENIEIDKSTPDERVLEVVDPEEGMEREKKARAHVAPPSNKPRLNSKEEVYEVFRQDKGLDVRKLKQHYDVSSFKDTQLAAYKAHDTMRRKREQSESQ